jgi:hypothetical protein
MLWIDLDYDSEPRSDCENTVIILRLNKVMGYFSMAAQFATSQKKASAQLGEVYFLIRIISYDVPMCLQRTVM